MAAKQFIWDDYNCNLDVIHEKDGLTISTRSEGGFAYLWSGARTTFGVVKGKWFFECHVLENTPVDMPDTSARNQNVMRVGFSEGLTNLTLGEVPGSFGFGGTGKKATKRKFDTYGKPFSVGDTVGCYIDLDKMTVSFSRNGEFFGVAFKIPESMKGCGFFPHAFLKNVKITTWMGEGQRPHWAQKNKFGYEPIATAPDEVRCLPHHQKPASKKDCELVMMVGIPATGKTTWAHKYVKSTGKKFDVLSTDLVLDNMRVNNMRRKGNFKERFDRCMKMASSCFNEFVAIAKNKNRNYVLDQTNVFSRARSRKIQNFRQWHKVAAVCIPTMEDYKFRQKKCAEKNKIVPQEIVNKMISNFEIPTLDEFDDIVYTDAKEVNARQILSDLKLNPPRGPRGSSGGRGGGRGRGRGGGRRDQGHNNNRRDRDYGGGYNNNNRSYNNNNDYNSGGGYHNNNNNHGGGYNNNDNYGGGYNNNNNNNYGGGYDNRRNNRRDNQRW